MIKIRNKSNSDLTLSFNRKDHSVLTETLKPKQFIFLENTDLTKSLIIQKRKDNISVDEHEELPSWMETEKVYSMYTTDPALKAAMSEAGKEAIIKSLTKEKEVDKGHVNNEQEAGNVSETHFDGKNSTIITELVKSKGGRPKGAKNKPKKKKKATKKNTENTESNTETI